MTSSPTKTKTSLYRRLFIAILINDGVNTVPQITALTGMPRRTVQDTIKSLTEIDISCVYIGAKKDGHYDITNWGPIDKQWVESHRQHIINVLDILN